MDNEKNCNVGYAFINFIDLAALKDFFEKFNGKGWPIFRSTKICKMTYARIQGLSDWLKHFKDTAVMKDDYVMVRPFVMIQEIQSLVESQKKEKMGK
jgi:hypothetical protein